MSIQILGLRTFERDNGEKTTTDCFHKNGWRSQSVKDLFQNLEQHLAQIPSDKRWNLFYTLANCSDKKRDFVSQAVIAFDIDGVPEEKRVQAALAACGALNLEPKKTAQVSSGGGLHLVVLLASPITDKQFFKDYKADYGFACDAIAKALTNANIEHKAVDPVVFEPRRILRLPGTENRKVGKPPRPCSLIQSNMEPQEFDLRKFSPIGGPVGKGHAIPARALSKYGQTDTEAVLDGCNFLRACKAEPGRVNEPQWYAALSIVARLSPAGEKTGNDLCHELSSGHGGYSLEETDKKISQALDASGPRTCLGINQLWGKCHECPHFEKIGSPIQIVSPLRIATELTGFHRIAVNGKASPQAEDLRLFFKREKLYKTLAGARTTFIWNGKHYEGWENNRVEQFAHHAYLPKVGASALKSFRELVGATELVAPDWFAHSTAGKINFQNGVLDIKSKDFAPHDPAYGFRYVLPYPYDPDAKAPLFLKMLGLVTPDTTLQKIILEFIGYCLSGDSYWVHKTLVLEGTGSNGKSTLVEVLQALVGDESYSTCSLKDLDDEYTRAMFDGKLFNISEETPTKALMDSSYFKAMSAGSAVTARSPYKEPFTLRNRAKLILLCNDLSKSMDTSHGFLRRLLIVPFDQRITRKTIPDFDPFLIDKLKGELSGIFNLALEGYYRLKEQRHFSESEIVDNKLNEYETSINTVKRWYEDEVIILTNGHAKSWTPIGDLYESYKLFTRRDEMYPVNAVRFAKELKRIVPEYTRRHSKRRVEGAGRSCSPKWGVEGVGLADNYTDADHAHGAEQPFSI